jgi:hypothetical protein
MERRTFLRISGAADVCPALPPAARTVAELQGTNGSHAQEKDGGPVTMADLKHVTYCGLYCKLCARMARIPGQAAELRRTLQLENWDRAMILPDPKGQAFWDILTWLAQSGESCSCRGGCGWPDCPMRKCARAKGLDVCSACPEFPCKDVKEFSRSYPTLIADNMRQRDVGMEQWIEEQEARCQRGFCANQIWCQPKA